MRTKKDAHGGVDGGEIYTIERAAALLGVAERTLRETIGKGEIKASKRFGRYFILHSDLLEFLVANRVNVK